MAPGTSSQNWAKDEITFSIEGINYHELHERAGVVLEELLGEVSVISYEIDIAPLVQTMAGEILTWKGEVHAQVRLPQ